MLCTFITQYNSYCIVGCVHEKTSPKNQPYFLLTTMRQYWLGETKSKQAFRSTQNELLRKLRKIYLTEFSTD